MAEKLSRSDRLIYAAFGLVFGLLFGAVFIIYASSGISGELDLGLIVSAGLGAAAILGLIGWLFGEWTVALIQGWLSTW